MGVRDATCPARDATLNEGKRKSPICLPFSIPVSVSQLRRGSGKCSLQGQPLVIQSQAVEWKGMDLRINRQMTGMTYIGYVPCYSHRFEL